MIDAYEFARGIKVLLLSEMPPNRRPALQGIRCVALDSCAIELFGAPIAQLRAFARLIKTHLLEIHKIQQITTTISYASGGIVVRWDSVPQTNPPPVAMVIQINAFHRFRAKPRLQVVPMVPQKPHDSQESVLPLATHSHSLGACPMTTALANTYEPLCSLNDCRLILDRRHKEILLVCQGQKASHFDPCIALAVAQGLVAASRSKEPGMIVQIPRFNARKPMAPVEYFTRIWVDSDARIFVQTQGPHNGPVYAFDIWETITLVQGLISGVRALQGWR